MMNMGKPSFGLGFKSSSSSSENSSNTPALSGIGAKLMAKMGYKGGGLGRAEQGRVAPVAASKQISTSGLGFQSSFESQTHEYKAAEVQIEIKVNWYL